MNYKIEIDKRAVKFIAKQPEEQRQRIFKAISQLPFQGDVKALKGYKHFFRLRVGDYRIIYTVDHDVLLVRVVEIDNR